MRKVINGKLYDTETATEVAEGGSSGYVSVNDFRYYTEVLYKTARGRWFLAGEGGAMTKYARSAGQNCQTGGSAIIPLSADEALEWMESNQVSAATIAKHFTLEDA